MEPEVVCELLLHCTKPEINQKHDEPTTENKPETVNIIAQEEPVQVERSYEKPKETSAIYAKKGEGEHLEKEEEEEHLKKKIRTTFVAHIPIPEEEELEMSVQKALKVKVGASVECAICRLAMESLDTVIAANATQQEVERGLKELCKVLPSSVREPCDDFINTYTPALVDLILQELDPFLICNELGVCNGTEAQLAPLLRAAEELKSEVKMQRKEDTKVSSTFECQLCQLIVGTVDSFIGTNRSEAAIQSMLDGICDILPESIEKQCRSFVDEYTVVVVQLLLQEMDPQQVCIFIKVCQPNSTHAVQEKHVGNDLLCSLCDIVIGEVAFIIGDNKSEPAVKSALEKVCGRFPVTIRNECVNFVDTYAPAIINLLVQEIDPHKICTLLGLCKSTKEVQEKPVGDDLLCSLCDIVIGEVAFIIGDNKSEPAVKSALEKVCGRFPVTIRNECVNFVDTYAPDIINLLVQEIDPHKICTLLGLCKSTKGELPKRTQPEVPEEGPLCSLCEMVMSQLEDLLGDNRTEAAIENALDQVCNFLPAGDKRAECISIVKLYAPAIIDLLIQEVPPKEICKSLRLCAADRVEIELPTLPAEKSPEPQEGDNIYCEMCKAIITEINNYIKENRSEAALIHAVEVVCDFMSGDLKLQCKSEVENYGPAVIDLLAHMDDPLEVCKAIKLCLTSNDSEKKKVKPVKLTPGEECLICQTLAGYAGEALNDPNTADEVETILKDACKLMPVPAKDICTGIVNQFTPEVLAHLAEIVNPLHFCQEIDLCSKDNMEKGPTLVGADPCTYGPAFWCANMDNAKKCQVVDDCINKYGMKPEHVYT